jgi:carbamoyl-phosphate synthase large subunit
MKQMRVLLTGAGGVAVPFLIESLHAEGHFVIAVDMDVHAAGLYLADTGYVVPRADAREFLPALRAICRKEHVDIIIPLVDEELIHMFTLESEGCTILLPRKEFVTTCLDKYHLMECLNNHGIRVPSTTLAREYGDQSSFPAIIKPRRGRGSRDVCHLQNREEFIDYLRCSTHSPDQLIVQEYIRGVEFTVSVVVWRDGEVQAVIPKEILSKKGITRMAVTRRNTRIEEICHRIQHTMSADGPFNVQLILDEQTHEPCIFEINPRFSTTITLTMAAGIDELNGLISQAVGGRQSYHFPEWKEGLVLFRRTVDEFWTEPLLGERSPHTVELPE